MNNPSTVICNYQQSNNRTPQAAEKSTGGQEPASKCLLSGRQSGRSSGAGRSGASIRKQSERSKRSGRQVSGLPCGIHDLPSEIRKAN
ncbi:MAG: hypothetical protein ABII90_03090, partial [Bacteroidota bacterium]